MNTHLYTHMYIIYNYITPYHFGLVIFIHEYYSLCIILFIYMLINIKEASHIQSFLVKVNYVCINTYQTDRSYEKQYDYYLKANSPCNNTA